MRRTSYAIDAAFFIVVVLVPLAWTKLFIAEFTITKLVVLNAGLVLAALAATASPTALSAGSTVLDRPIVAGFVILLLSAALSDDPFTSLRGRYDSYAYGVWGLALAAAAAQFAARGARGREQEAVRLVVWSAAAVGGYAILQKFGIDPIFHLKELPAGGRAVSTLGSPVDLGAFLALLWPAALWRLDSERGTLSAVLAALVAGGLIASGARGAMLGAGVGTAIYWALTRREPSKTLPLAPCLAVAAAAAAIAWSCRAGASVSDQARVEVWKAALAAFRQHPWLGWGPDGFEDAFKILRSEAFVSLLGPMRYQAYAHNDLLHVLSGLGLAGAAAYAGLWASLYGAARRALESARGRGLAAGLAAGLIALWVNLALNPVAHEVLVLAAVCAGLLASQSAPAQEKAPSRLPFAVLAGLAAVSLFHSVTLARADAAYKRGIRALAAGTFAVAQSE
ncbi:MAG: O-antigen ligase family protein, partial [Elusimicrobiota bacterium]